MARRPFTITQLRCEAGVWKARVTVDGDGVDVDRRYGSWQIPGEDGRTTELLFEVAQALADAVRPLERKGVDEKPKAKTKTQNGPAQEVVAEPANPFLAGVQIPPPVPEPKDALAGQAARFGVTLG